MLLNIASHLNKNSWKFAACSSLFVSFIIRVVPNRDVPYLPEYNVTENKARGKFAPTRKRKKKLYFDYNARSGLLRAAIVEAAKKKCKKIIYKQNSCYNSVNTVLAPCTAHTLSWTVYFR